MKKMKRLVAILLASVLALAMLTACGEEAPQSLGQRAENLMIESFNKAYDTTYQNDADLKNKVGAMLNQIDENGEIDIASLNKSKMLLITRMALVPSLCMSLLRVSMLTRPSIRLSK